MIRTNHHTKSPWEPIVGYSRAVKKGPFITVAGTTSTDPETGEFMHPGDAHLQTMKIFDNIEKALQALGSSLKDVVRTRMFVKNIAQDNEAIGKAHYHYFGASGIEPVATMVEVSGFIDSRMLVEIEVDAIIG
ncbi:Endoribonuclease L-PSP/chorismate mutase-like protein [Obelidium mucronatum]|nr:Endoribonuclease L-PSP/chorismate mutase-like protein [Obelidium mucronatum]